MTEINENYPYGLKNKEIEDAIRDYSQEIYKAKASPNAVLQFSPLIQLGQSELQGRQIKKATWLSVGVAFLSLAVAGSALYVSLTSSRSNEQWENSQLLILESIRKDINNSSSKITETIVIQNGNTTETITNAAIDIIKSLEIEKEKTANKSLKHGTRENTRAP